MTRYGAWGNGPWSRPSCSLPLPLAPPAAKISHIVWPAPLPSLTGPLLVQPPSRLLRLLRRPVNHILREDADLLTRWRARMTAAFLLAAATFGLIPAFAATWVALRDGLYLLAVVDVIGVATVYLLLLSRRVSNQVRNVFLSGISLVIGISALVTLGPWSTALAWLLISLFLATFLVGPTGTVVVILGILGTLVGISAGIETRSFAWVGDLQGGAERWFLVSLDFTFLVLIFAGANTFIIQLLEREDAARSLAEARLAEGRRNEALGRLASGIAHDFNNLLVPVLGNVEAVRESLPPESPAAQALDDAHRSARRAGELVRRILAFGRGMDAERVALDPAAAAREVVELVRLGHPPALDLRIETEADAMPPPRVWAAPPELHQVFHNLVTNAVHAASPDGWVRVSVRGAFSPGSVTPEAVFEVRDSGQGMPPATLERIFDPYFSTREPGRGTGLGLPIVRSVVHALGGSIEVESIPGVGSTFRVRLPADDPKRHLRQEAAAVSPDRPVAPTLPDPGGSRKTAAGGQGPAAVVPPPLLPPQQEPGMPLKDLRILLVDDEEGVRRAIARMLASLGARVRTAADGEEARRILEEAGKVGAAKEAATDLLLTDLRMPGMTGSQVVAMARALTSDLPVVVMSGHVEDTLRRELPGPAERTGLLQKPFDREELTAAVLRVLPPR